MIVIVVFLFYCLSRNYDKFDRNMTEFIPSRMAAIT